MFMNCNGDCFNCIYDDCIKSDSQIKSLRLEDKRKAAEDIKPSGKQKKGAK